jgi:hypothetical protein
MSNNPQQGSQHGQGTHKDNPGGGQQQQQQDPQKSGQQGGTHKPGQQSGDTGRK